MKIVHPYKIYEVLGSIEKNPKLWLTEKSITALQNFINGLLTAKTKDLVYEKGEPTFDEFKYWILNKNPKINGIGNPYSRVILTECDGDEQKAFDLFFKYLEEFKINA